MCNSYMIKGGNSIGYITSCLEINSSSGGGEVKSSSSAIELKGNRVAGNNSIIAREDGSFFDFNGSINYQNIDELLRAHPELESESGEYIPPFDVNPAHKHDYREVTRKAKNMKARYDKSVIDHYLPLYDTDRIISNVGITFDGNLGVFMWRTTLNGAPPGVHYGIAQYRGDERAKWMSVKGSDAKTVEAIVTDDLPVYATFGMGDFLILKSTGLNYMCFAGDGAARNSPYTEYMKHKVENRVIRLLADNDHSGRQTAKYLRKYGFTVEVIDWNKFGSLSKPKMDLRDITGIIASRGGNLNDLKDLLTTKDMYVN